MSQRPQSGSQSTQPGFLPGAPSNTQNETEVSPPITDRPQVRIQDSQPIINSGRVSIQEPPPIIHNRRVSIQEPPPINHNRRVSIQEPPLIIHNRRASIQGPPPIINSHRVSIQEPLSIIHNRRVSIQDPPLVHSRWASIQDAPPIIHSCWVSTEDMPSTVSGHRLSIQDAPSVTYSHRLKTQDVPPTFQTRHFSIQNSLLLPHVSLNNVESLNYNSSQVSSQDHLPTSQSPCLSTQCLTLPIRAKVDVPPSITHSPTASVKSTDSIIWTTQESFKDSMDSSLYNPSTLDNIQSIRSSRSAEMDSGGCQRRSKCSYSQLPMGWRLLHGAKKISRQVSLALSLAGMVIIGLITLGQPWIHFQVPLTPPGDPDGPSTIPINTIFFVQCPDISCLHEYDQNAYLLDFAWAFLILASIAGFCLCIMLINIIFFTSSNLPVLDFSNVIISILTGASMILGILFYLMQAHEYLQEGMTYTLGLSFYLAWTGIFLFLMSGFLSYLNYMNFWSILALQAIWT
ncbi:uncharacterized protein LOC123578680 isoform X1 [Leopardus geoffroyi]|uniref:uncharacterized protein LOC123578680 isoform X1 n=1 Tax=Leopardus geoffroyi TaxID=46844 RepID=UPI001E25D504|nr:uncharacterized protein LOC123578680 isoform X1 [Leopardus geoffroyi]